ncbi:MAG: HAD-IIIC family phosphatase [Magnetococcales bacterium]|nr:HAD-IIIC family phosphatase [Magnetococcales bacterium]
MREARAVGDSARREHKIKCVVWDLDNTLWNGTLLEDQQVTLFPHTLATIKTLDERGILQSIASKNDADLALAKLKEFNLDDYFIYPKINWNPKSASVEQIAKEINIGLDTIAFVDDQPYEREEVAFSQPKVLCIDAREIGQIPDMPEMQPRFVTDDSRRRRHMYQSDIQRNQVEKAFTGPQDAFLQTLAMVFTIAPAKEEDLKRAEELTVRTNQLNTTGYTYTYDELNFFRQSKDHLLLVATLDDKFGTYGKIGLALITCDKTVWRIKLLLMSCRVMARGVGSVLINHIRNEARRHGVRLEAEMLTNDRNRMMYMTYKFTHFTETNKEGELIIFENDLSKEQKFPDFLQVVTD